MEINTYLSISTVNINELNTTIKRHNVAEWVKNKIYLYAVFKKLTSGVSK